MADQQVAQTILRQLGGSRFRAMTGATSFTSGPASLSFRLGRNPKGIAAVVVELDASDTYTVTFFKRKPFPVCVAVEAEVRGVYCDSLARVFTAQTGLLTSL